ncbi:MAG: hypothetical protein AVDCRST_MAG27-1289 [uncultured Craurococcus sp.]|uniref:Mobile element protein n=1 Tax=uncultured Craurococcus sp. TaxID=1135998 RepID=A0A6J4I121_9PROT|nr:MAG: hypothetical protein AVDCRST_MAG27-1289 [uncultured Craurococcus sp.]
MTPEPATHRRHRFPAEVISHAVWLHHVLSSSLRDIELILAERGIGVTHGSVRQWCLRFGADFARRLRRRRPKPGNTWHLDGVFLRINGALHHIRPRRHLMTAARYRRARAAGFRVWREETRVQAAA